MNTVAIIALLTFTTFLHAVGERPLSEEKQILLEKIRNAPEDLPEATIRRVAQRPSVHYHWVKEVALDGKAITTEDGAQWNVADTDYYKTTNWKEGDVLTLSPNNWWFCTHHYYLTNQNAGSYVRVNLAIGPVAYGPKTHFIVGIDYKNSALFLENNTSWIIPSTYASIFEDFAVNDTIIIGVNETWVSTYDTMLINVNLNTYLPAKKF